MKDNQFYKTIGESIRSKRISLGITQAELSRKLGFKSPTNLFHIEKGNRRLTLKDYFALREIFENKQLIKKDNDWETTWT